MFLRVYRSEWLKRKRSFASALVLGASLFTPAVVVLVRLLHHKTLPAVYAAPEFWPRLWRDSWESMAIFFLPLGTILATSLVTQIEFRGNAWKQVHTLPVPVPMLFAGKLAVILTMLAELLLLFNAGVYLSAMLPFALLPGVPAPRGSFFALPLLHDSALYFVECLPILAAQYLMALRSNNALVPIGIGFAAWVGALAAVSSKAALWWPYAFPIVHYLRDKPKGAHLAAAAANVPWLAAAFFVVLTMVSYWLFRTNRAKG